MTSSKKLQRIKKDIERKKGKLIIIKFEDGSELKVMPSVVLDSFVNYKAGTEFIEVIKNKEIVSCSGSHKLINIIKQLIEYEGEPLKE